MFLSFKKLQQGAAVLVGLSGLMSTTSVLAADRVAPTITDIHFVTTSVDPRSAPGAFQISLSYSDVGDDGTRDSSSGVSYIFLRLRSSSTGQQFDYNYDFRPIGVPKAVINIETQPLNLYAAPGQWTFDLVGISDAHNNSRFYSTDLPLTGGNAVVANTVSPDTAAPAITSAKLTTTVVSLADENPTVGFRLQLQDNLSGVVMVQFRAVDITSGTSIGNNALLTVPLISGAVNTGFNLYSGFPPGTYNVTELTACDRPGNCRGYTGRDLSAILPKARFRVVN